MVLGIGVLDAPMIWVDSDGELSYEPWIRLIRQESQPEKGHWTERERLTGIDIVHVNYLPNFLSQLSLLTPQLAE